MPRPFLYQTEAELWDAARAAGYDMLVCYDIAALVLRARAAGGDAAGYAADIESSLWNLSHGERRELDALMLDALMLERMIGYTRRALDTAA